MDKKICQRKLVVWVNVGVSHHGTGSPVVVCMSSMRFAPWSNQSPSSIDYLQQKNTHKLARELCCTAMENLTLVLVLRKGRREKDKEPEYHNHHTLRLQGYNIAD